jgi:hypothetical protein
MGQKKWYLLVDDDTLLVPPTIRALLSRLDPDAAHYIGNPVGDFRARFAHGGSGIILSSGAVTRLQARLSRHEGRLLAGEYERSLSEVWGDRLLATALQRAGVYLDERFAALFNGERPRLTRMRNDRMCLPLATFHGLAKGPEMREAGEVVGRWVGKDGARLRWMDVWEAFGGTRIGTEAWRGKTKKQQHDTRDHVGPGAEDEVLTRPRVGSAEECEALCARYWKRCLAWTWIRDGNVCRVSPWVVVGAEAEGVVSGVNRERFEGLVDRCPRL